MTENADMDNNVGELRHDDLCMNKHLSKLECNCDLIWKVQQRVIDNIMKLPFEIVSTNSSLRMMIVKEDAIAAAKGAL